ncbi:MAG: hypothetical protein ACRDH5_01515 [bacterium]
MKRLATRLGLILLGLALPLGGFLLAQAILWNGSLPGTRAVTAAAREIYRRDPTPAELQAGVALWRRSPAEFREAVKQLKLQQTDNTPYGLALVAGRASWRRSSPS